MVKRFEVYLVALDPVVGSEYQKTRPCLIVSPDELNRKLPTVIIAPMTSKQRPYLMRVKCRFQDKDGDIALDQLRAVDKKRLGRQLGTLDDATAEIVTRTLVEMFS